MAPMWRRALALLVSMLALLAAPGVLSGCGQDPVTEEPPSGFALAPDQLVVPRSAIAGHPPANRWEVEVAVVGSDVDRAILLPEPPENALSRKVHGVDDRAALPVRARSGTDSLTIADIPTDGPDLQAQEAASARSP